MQKQLILILGMSYLSIYNNSIYNNSIYIIIYINFIYIIYYIYHILILFNLYYISNNIPYLFIYNLMYNNII